MTAGPTARVVGAGIMGAGIAARFAIAGVQVELVERDPVVRAGAPFRIRFGRHMVGHATSLGHISIDVALAAAERISIVATPGEAFEAADFTLEAVIDDVATKHDVYRSLTGLVHERSIVASTTAALPIEELAIAAPNPERFIGWHWAFPSLVVTYAEVIPASRTADETIAWTVRTARRLGKSPTIVRDGSRRGFALNRIWYAMMDEARALVEEGVATEDAVDRQYETSQRWPRGPFRIDREDDDVVGRDPWPELTVASFGLSIDSFDLPPTPDA